MGEYRVEKYYIGRSHKAFGVIDVMSWKAKCLRNSILYELRQIYFGNRGKESADRTKFPGNKELDLLTKKLSEKESMSLPAKLRQLIVAQVVSDFQNFLAASVDYAKNPKKYMGKPGIPKYVGRNKGYMSGGHRSSIYFSPQCISRDKKLVKSDELRLSGIDFNFKLISENLHTYEKTFNADGSPKMTAKGNHAVTESHSIKSVEIRPFGDGYELIVVYDAVHPLVERKRKVVPLIGMESRLSCGIDLGVRNLAAVAFGDYSQSLLVKGQVLLSINSYAAKLRGKNQALHEELIEKYNNAKKNKSGNVGHLRRKVKQCELMARIIERKRVHKVTDYLHKVTTALANQLAERNVIDVYVGYNERWKQEVNLGRVNNQNFTQIPHLTFLEMLEYKCRRRGMSVHRVDERNTSVASFYDGDPLCTGTVFSGKRHRKWYTTKNGTKINADINAAYNIIRAGNGNFTSIWDVNNPVKGFVVSPVCLITQCNELFKFAA